MAGKGLSRDQVYAAALELTQKSKKLTTDAVREHLGTGSKTTVHKYLKDWKRQRLLGPQKVQNLDNKIIDLERELSNQLELNQQISQEHLLLQKEYLEIDNKYQGLLKNNIEYQNLIVELEQKLDFSSQLLNEIKQERETAISTIIEDKNKMIDALNLELSSIHKASLELIRKTSTESNDQLMEAKIKNINLQNKSNELKNRIKILTQDKLLKNG